MPQIIHERPEDAALIEPLLEKCFGEDRFKKTAYKIRQHIEPLPELSFVAVEGETLLATIRYWPITIGGTTRALLLGPIAVEPELQGKGVGVALIRQSMKVAVELGHEIIVLVGDPEYYERFNFERASMHGLELPGPAEDRRFLVHECVPGALIGVTGMIEGAKLPGLPKGRIAAAAETARLSFSLAALAPPDETQERQQKK